MGAVARLDAAIAKLEALRAESFAGPWSALGSGVANGDHWYVVADHESILSVSANDGSDEEFRQPTAELIVTLHRTIDAQLAILLDGRDDLARRYVSGDARIYPFDRHVALAHAILGGD